jgi:hypothetical protein
MPTQNSSAHFFLSWAKERIDEMDAILASLESKAAQMQAETRVKADQFIAEMKKKRDEFESTVKKQAEAGEAAAEGAKVRLEAEWRSTLSCSAGESSNSRLSSKARSQLS